MAKKRTKDLVVLLAIASLVFLVRKKAMAEEIPAVPIAPIAPGAPGYYPLPRRYFAPIELWPDQPSVPPIGVNEVGLAFLPSAPFAQSETTIRQRITELDLIPIEWYEPSPVVGGVAYRAALKAGDTRTELQKRLQVRRSPIITFW